MQPDAKIYVAGHRGMVGAALVRRFERAGYHNLVVRTSQELDLRDQAAVAAFFARERPEKKIITDAKAIKLDNSDPKKRTKFFRSRMRNHDDNP